MKQKFLWWHEVHSHETVTKFFPVHDGLIILGLECEIAIPCEHSTNYQIVCGQSSWKKWCFSCIVNEELCPCDDWQRIHSSQILEPYMRLSFLGWQTSIKSPGADSHLSISDVEEFVEYTDTFIYCYLIGMHEQQLNTGGGFLTITIWQSVIV